MPNYTPLPAAPGILALHLTDQPPDTEVLLVAGGDLAVLLIEQDEEADEFL